MDEAIAACREDPCSNLSSGIVLSAVQNPRVGPIGDRGQEGKAIAAEASVPSYDSIRRLNRSAKPHLLCSSCTAVTGPLLVSLGQRP